MTTDSAQITHGEQEEPIPGAPPAPPREVTALVRRRAWRERHVRLWWLLGAVTLVITAYYAVYHIYLWSDEARLIKNGVQVSAEVVAGGGNAAPKGMKRPLPADTVVDMEFFYKEKKYEIRGALAGRTEQIMTRTPIPIFIDPNDPMHWTGRTTPGSIAQALLGAIMLSPIVVILFLAALLSHKKVLRIYRDGEAIPGEVVRVSQSAAAPLSRMIGCAAHFEDDDRLIKVLLPTSKTPAVGESLWLIALPGKLERAIPVALFE